MGSRYTNLISASHEYVWQLQYHCNGASDDSDDNDDSGDDDDDILMVP